MLNYRLFMVRRTFSMLACILCLVSILYGNAKAERWVSKSQSPDNISPLLISQRKEKPIMRSFPSYSSKGISDTEIKMFDEVNLPFFCIGFYQFTSESMREVYGSAVTLFLSNTWWGEKFGGGVELGFFECEGTPEKISSEWSIGESSLKMNSLYFGINAYYNFIGSSDTNFFNPYVGIGPVMYIGWERIAVEASICPIGIEEGFYAELLGVGVSFGACTMLGTTIHLSDKVNGLVEFRYIVSQSSEMGDLIEDEKKDDFNSSLYRVVKRPGYNLRGWQINFGIQY